jgi:hydroxyacylglutathione hydrolase
MPSQLKILSLSLGELNTNCYLAWCSQSLEAVIIDPADSGDFISEKISELGLKPQAILLTHGHFDHVLGTLEVKLNFDLPIFLHSADWSLLKNAQSSARHWLKREVDPVPTPNHELKAGMELPLGELTISVIETPGHTQGSVSLSLPAVVWTLYSDTTDHAEVSIISKAVDTSFKTTKSVSEKAHNQAKSPVLFTGDTLFKNGVGRTDFSYSQPMELERSLEKIFQLPANTLCLPGHGPQTTVGQEINR